jgi:hypothetical protein
MELNQRERLLLICAIIILLPLMITKFVLIPIYDYQKESSVRIKKLEQKIDQIHLLGQELKYLKRGTRSRSISLSKRIDSILRLYKLKGKSRIVVEQNPDGGQRLVLKLDEINLTEMANVIYKIENAKPSIFIDNLDINKSYKNKKLFRLSFALTST